MPLDKLYTKGWDWLLTYGPRIAGALILFIAGEWLIKIIRKKLAQKLTKKKVSSTLQPFLQSILIASLHVVLVLLVMQVVGIQFTIFAAVIAAFGAAVGLALSGTLQNFASGIIILILKPFLTGDNIIAQNQEGTIISIQLFYTVMKTFDNRIVILPNGKLSNEVIINITREGKRRLDIEMKFPLAKDFQNIKSVIFETLDSESDIIRDPQPRIGITSFESDGYKCMINIWVKAHGFEDTRMAVNEKILRAVQKIDDK